MGSKQEWRGSGVEAIPEALRKILSRIPRIAISFSGGLDSRFLCRAASLMGLDILAIHAAGPHVSPRESEFAKQWAAKNEIAFRGIWSDPLTLPEVAINSRSRCYACKKSLARVAREAALDFGGVLCDGGNADDLKVYRPGLRAAREEGIFSPLAMAAMGKSEIRAAARESGMDWPDQKARPCLLTRYAYGLSPNAGTLRRLAEAEFALEGELPNCDFRLRLKPEPELQIDRDIGATKDAVLKILAERGFEGAAIKTVERVDGYYDRRDGG